MIIEALKKLTKHENLSKSYIKEVLKTIIEDNSATKSQIAAFLTALRMKGETIEEITGAVEFLREQGETLALKDKNVIDIVGTGGDGSNTFNISTATAFLVAAGGVKVAKHGAKASSSKSGAADVLEELGVNIMLEPSQNEELLEKTGICFMFAPKYNPLMKNAADVRQEIKIRNIFNCLGPLINPSNAKNQLIGVYDKKLVNPVAQVMVNLGIENGIALYGDPGLDEASVVSRTYFSRIKNGKIEEGSFVSSDFGIKEAEMADIRGGTPKENAKIIKDIFKGEIKGAKKEIVALNAALAFLIMKKTETIQEGLDLAYDLISSGAALQKLESFVKETNEYS